MEHLQTKLIHLQKQFRVVDDTTNRANLFQPTGSLWQTDNGDEDDDDDPVLDSVYSVRDLKQQQVRILEDQDHGLEALSKVISRQKDLAIRIGDEVDIQNDILDTLGDQMENTDLRINRETQHIGTVSRKDATCGYYVVIGILFVAILVVLFI